MKVSPKAILLRVGCDSGAAGGSWNAPINTKTGEYVYVPIPAGESDWEHIRNCKCPTYDEFQGPVEKLGAKLPFKLSAKTLTHLDPDFKTLTHGEPDIKGSPRHSAISHLQAKDIIVFYGSFQRVGKPPPKVYCLIGIFHIERVCRVKDLTMAERKLCAHGRRTRLGPTRSDNDFVFWASRQTSGRFSKAIEIGLISGKSYRARPALVRKWGGLTHTSIQRSLVPRFQSPERFLAWLKQERRTRKISLIRSNT